MNLILHLTFTDAVGWTCLIVGLLSFLYFVLLQDPR